ncbi:hypothetical protein Pfo_015941 [Paulownia fortunei]|nr:hypothetical protein Pfo_015941 [Paulownia fortunei]
MHCFFFPFSSHCISFSSHHHHHHHPEALSANHHEATAPTTPATPVGLLFFPPPTLSPRETLSIASAHLSESLSASRPVKFFHPRSASPFPDPFTSPFLPPHLPRTAGNQTIG